MTIIKKSKDGLGSLRAQIELDRKHRDVPHAPEAVVLAIDCSWSMKDRVKTLVHKRGIRKLDVAIEAAAELVKVSRRDTLFLCLGFAERARSDEWKIGKAVIESFARLELDYDTNIGRALHMGHGRLSDWALGKVTGTKISQKRMILLSDGGDNYGLIHKLEDELLMFIEDRIPVDTVAFGVDADMELLRRIAELTGGVFQESTDADGLVRAYRQLESSARLLLTKGK